MPRFSCHSDADVSLALIHLAWLSPTTACDVVNVEVDCLLGGGFSLGRSKVTRFSLSWQLHRVTLDYPKENPPPGGRSTSASMSLHADRRGKPGEMIQRKPLAVLLSKKRAGLAAANEILQSTS